MSLTRFRPSRALGFLAACALALAACGGGSVESSEVLPTVPPVVEATPTPLPTEAPVVIPTTATSTPVPVPTTPPEPLTDPTPSAVLLTTAFTNSSSVTTVGIDELFFGMTPDEAAAAASTVWVVDGDENRSCYLISPANGPEGVSFWVVDGHIERVDVEHPDIRTRSRMGIGNTLAEIQGQLGDRLTTEPAADDGGIVGTFIPADLGDRNFHMVFEFVDDKVVRYRSGRIGIVDRARAGCR